MPDNSTANTFYNQSSSPQVGSYGQNIKNAGAIGPRAYRAAGAKLQAQGYGNLLDLLQGQGRMDPRILARQQALNSLYTQNQQNQFAGNQARSGFGGGGLNQALQAAISQAGQTRDQNLRYQDIAASYARNQQNLGLLNDLVIQPGLQYAGVGASQANADRSNRNQGIAAGTAVLGNILGYYTGGTINSNTLKAGEDAAGIK